MGHQGKVHYITNRNISLVAISDRTVILKLGDCYGDVIGTSSLATTDPENMDKFNMTEDIKTSKI